MHYAVVAGAFVDGRKEVEEVVHFDPLKDGDMFIAFARATSEVIATMRKRSYSLPQYEIRLNVMPTS